MGEGGGGSQSRPETEELWIKSQTILRQEHFKEKHRKVSVKKIIDDVKKIQEKC